MGILLPIPTSKERERAVDVFSSLLEKSGSGIHTLTAHAEGMGGRVVEQFHFAQDPSALISCEEMLLPFVQILAVGVAGASGGMILRTWGHQDTVRAWAFQDGSFMPLTKGELMHSFRYNSETGEVEDLPGNTEYLDAPAL
ncbi:hypothetical protein [Streptomyces nitrosporeus]|uniref:hypothetical protein n=1 Tax=Streptomyces nitrosporeus TaxID=28894 RepID=UPI00167EEB5F|nr:hypothetical protein [Streptomyces nitrosporeus]